MFTGRLTLFNGMYFVGQRISLSSGNVGTMSSRVAP